MSKPPLAWSITSTKRKAKSDSSTPVARKRPRVSGEEDAANPARRKSQSTLTQAQWMATIPPSCDEPEMQLLDDEPPQSKVPRRARNQQTLTQAQWVKNVPPRYEEAEMQVLDEGRLQSEMTRKRPRQTLKPRDSTLTQMDFFNPSQDCYDYDEAMIDADRPPPPPRALPQIDGTYDSPRKPRRRKATPAAIDSSTKRRDALESQEEYKPSLKKRKIEVTENEPLDSTKRKSRRLAKKSEVFSDPVRNLDYFTEALGTPSIIEPNRAALRPFMYQLEIRDSTEDLEDALPELPNSRFSLLPQTPKRPKTIVLSSQSPESLRTSNRRTNRKLFETPTKSQRTPLAERSTNISVHPIPQTAVKRRAPKRPLLKSKVVVLKLPQRNQDKRPTRIEDSQTNLWSVPSSSPEILGNPPPRQVQSTVKVAHPELEIPATSQEQDNLYSSAGSEDSLPSLSDLLPRRYHGEALRDLTQTEAEGIIVRDFAAIRQTDSAKGPHRGEGTISSSPPALAARIPEHTLEVDDEILDFGSPVANDTQFNIQVQHRVSSPTPLERSLAEAGPAHYSSPSTPNPRLARAAGKDGPDLDLPDIERVQSSQSPVRAPRLVPRSSIEPLDEEIELDDNDTGEVLLPKPVFVHPSSIRRTNSTQVPLNDTYGSSSPRSRPTRSNTQKSVHPASMPHPSQMSTQDPTQAFLLPSSLPLNELNEFSERPENITIKDSSSSIIPISQIPRHVRRSQAGLDPGAALDEDFESGEEDAFDLDPPSLPSQLAQASRPQTKPVQKPLGRIRTSEESQMTAPASTAAPAGPSPEPQHPDLDNDSLPLRESQMPDSDLPSTPDKPPALQKQYSPIPGFDNETQSNFTQNGHFTAAFIHRQREAGKYPLWFVPTPYQVPGYTRR